MLEFFRGPLGSHRDYLTHVALPNSDVYMLGKLLWCMVTGRLVLQREWFNRPENDVTVIFRHDPHAHMINTILKKCVVEQQQECVGIHDIRAMAIAFVSLIEQGGQLLQRKVPRPCHVCVDMDNTNRNRLAIVRMWYP
jgi:hypothetical protein